MLGVEPGSPRIAIQTLNHWAISPAPKHVIFIHRLDPHSWNNPPRAAKESGIFSWWCMIPISPMPRKYVTAKGDYCPLPYESKGREQHGLVGKIGVSEPHAVGIWFILSVPHTPTNPDVKMSKGFSIQVHGQNGWNPFNGAILRGKWGWIEDSVTLWLTPLCLHLKSL